MKTSPTGRLLGSAGLVLATLLVTKGAFAAPPAPGTSGSPKGGDFMVRPEGAERRFRVSANLSFNRFEQQAKSEVGGAKGEKLVEVNELNLYLLGTYELLEWLRLGIYTQFDVGTRNLGRFAGLDAENKTQVEPALGGGYRELWIGPIAQFVYKDFFAELGYGAFGRRWDDGRPELANSQGDSSGAFSTSPSIAWMLGLGAQLPLGKGWDLTLRVQYRVRYYTQRGGEKIRDELVHGTQNFSPFVGVGYRF